MTNIGLPSLELFIPTEQNSAGSMDLCAQTPISLPQLFTKGQMSVLAAKLMTHLGNG